MHARNYNRERSIGARPVVALPRSRGPVASQRWGLFPSSLFGSVWRPASHRWHAGSTQVQSCLRLACALSLDATLPPVWVSGTKVSSTLRSKAHPARSARRRDQVKAEPSLFPAAAWPSQSPGRRPRLNPQSARPVPCQKGAGKTGGDFRFAFASRVCAHPTCEVALLTSPWGRRRRKEAAASTHAGGGAPAG